MPNYCENTLTVIGKPDEVSRFINKVYTKNGENPLPLDFNKIIPYPENFKYLDRVWQEEYELTGESPEWKDGFNTGGREWCIDNWGTKWNALYVNREVDTTDLNLWEANYYFDTAWSPPISVVAKMAEMFPSLEFDLYYEEGGEGYAGSNSFANGKQIAYDSYYIEEEYPAEY